MDSLIKFSSALKRKKLVSKAIAEIKEFLGEIADIQQFKTSDELAEVVTNTVEWLLAGKAKKYKIDKKQVCLEIYDAIFAESPLTGQERVDLIRRIDFLHEHGLIKGVSLLRQIKKSLIPYLLKKIL